MADMDGQYDHTDAKQVLMEYELQAMLPPIVLTEEAMREHARQELAEYRRRTGRLY